MENGGVICAPSTNITQHWGLVFDSCTIKAGEVFPEKASGYSLARPWQGEPRCYWLNTTMEILPSANGWRGMSKLVTHFYEYNSMDAKGNKLDLSKRGNSSSSINTYTPVLSDKEAEEFNVHNVLGGDDAWDTQKSTRQMPAPSYVNLNNGVLSWQGVRDACCYVVFADGKYLGNTTDESFSLPANTNESSAVYTLRAANEMGGLGEAARATVATGISAVKTMDCNKNNNVYNLEGKRVGKNYKGIVIVNGRKSCVK
jgi:hypothetical protein